MSRRTVIYAVHGRDMYFTEALRSARSVRQYDSNVKIIAYVRPEDASRLDASLYDEIRTHDADIRPELRIDFQLKMFALVDGLSGPTLFLDTDTLVCAPLTSAWPLLDRFDVLACHAPWRRRLRYENYDTPDFESAVPDAFCELNMGVVFLSDTERTRALLEAWQKLYLEAPGSGDQYLFMDALYHSDCRLYVLPPEYNYRYRVPQFSSDPVRILHGHGAEIIEARRIINTVTVPRVSSFEDGAMKVLAMKSPPDLTRRQIS